MNGQKIKEIRIERGYTQKELAARLGLNRHYIGAIENGRKKPSVATLERIADELKCSIRDFF